MSQEWISVKDRLPEENGSYLVVVCPILKKEEPFVTVSEYGFMFNPVFNGFDQAPISHWMPLPKAPK